MNIREEFKDKGYKFPLNNMQVEWCYFVKPDTYKGKSEWKCTIRLEEPLAMSMKDAGFNVKHTRYKNILDHSEGERPNWEEGKPEYFSIVATTKTNIKGKEMKPPRVVDADNQPMDGNKVGNGSVVNLWVFAKYWEVNGDIFLPLRLNEIQVVKLVEYNQSGFQAVGVDPGDTDVAAVPNSAFPF